MKCLIVVFMLLTGCATTHHRCVEYVWVPTFDGGHMTYHAERPICVEWEK